MIGNAMNAKRINQKENQDYIAQYAIIICAILVEKIKNIIKWEIYQKI